MTNWKLYVLKMTAHHQYPPACKCPSCQGRWSSLDPHWSSSWACPSPPPADTHENGTAGKGEEKAVWNVLSAPFWSKSTLYTQPSEGCFVQVTRWVPTPTTLISFSWNNSTQGIRGTEKLFLELSHSLSTLHLLTFSLSSTTLFSQMLLVPTMVSESKAEVEKLQKSSKHKKKLNNRAYRGVGHSSVQV